MKKRKLCCIWICIMMLLVCSACSNATLESADGQNGTVTKKETVVPLPESTPVVYEPDSYDTQDRALLMKVGQEEKNITLYHMDTGNTYTLEVVGTSTFSDKYGNPVSLKQLNPGDLVDVTFLKDIKRLNSLKIATDGWIIPEAERYAFDWERQQVTIGKNQYKLPSGVLIFSQGQQIQPMDLSEVDVLSFQGLGSSVYSIRVEKGHGYLRLENDEDFIGGFIEVGQSQIRKIEKDMLLTVPEGAYQVVISHNGGGGTKQVTITRNQEITLDIGDLEVVQAQFGTVVFETDVEEVTLYVDGRMINPALPLSLQYGIHQVIARAEGYETMTGYFKVNKATQNVEINMNQKEEQEKEETKEYKVYIDKPEGVEVYVDGNYVGVAPVSFKKEAGSHTITLRKTGYETRSYTISVDKEKKDSNYSFTDLTVGSLGDLSSVVLE